MSVPSLFHLASRTLALSVNSFDFSVKSIPNEVTEQLVLHFGEKKLLEFIESHGSLKKIKNTFSANGFQKFYLYLYNVKNVTTNSKSIKKIENYLNEFKKYLYYIEYNVQYFTFTNFCIQSLGFEKNCKKCHYVHYFFESKFRFLTTFHLRFSIPTFSPEITNLLPTKVDMNVLAHMNDFVYKKLPFNESDDIDQQFFLRLLDMSQAFINFRHHELLAIGFELVLKFNYFANAFRQNFYVYIYGMLAVVLARIDVNLEICWSFINKAHEFAHICSQKLDILLYQQEIFSYYNIYDKELIVFHKLFYSVPMESAFYKQTIYLHFDCTFLKVENYLCQAIYFREGYSVQEQNYFKSLIEKTLEILLKEQRFVYKCLSLIQIHEKMFQKFLLLLEIYIECVNVVGYLFSLYSKFDFIRIYTVRLLPYQTHLKYFFRYLNDGQNYTLEDFNQEMDIYKRVYEKQSNLKNGERWGNICFTLFLMFSIFSNDLDTSLDWFDKAMENYKINKSRRYKICWNFKHKNFSFQDINSNTSICPIPVDVKHLLKTDKNISKLTRLGVLSLIQSDATKFM